MAAVGDFEPFSRETLENPYPFYDRMRAERPVFEAAPGVFFVTTYDLIHEVLRDTERFSSARGAAFLNFQGEAGLAPPMAPSEATRAIFARGVPPRDTLLSADPPAHTRYRSLVNRSLSPRRVAKLEPIARQVVTELIDGFIDDGRVELVGQFSMMVPLTVVAITLGVPRSDLQRYKEWSVKSVAVLAGRVSEEERIEGARASVELQRYLARNVEAARADPQDDLIGDLITAHLRGGAGDDDHRELDTPEIVSILNQLLVAGQETVNYLIASLTLLLLRNPEVLAEVQADPSLIPAMVEEGVRIESPISALGRFVVSDTELGGTALPAGSRLVALFGCANRDPKRFPQPERFDIHRENLRDHVGFGAGPHYCVGAALARMETRVAFEELFRRLRNLRLAPGNDFTHQYNFIFRALKTLHLEFDKA